MNLNCFHLKFREENRFVSIFNGSERVERMDVDHVLFGHDCYFFGHVADIFGVYAGLLANSWTSNYR